VRLLLHAFSFVLLGLSVGCAKDPSPRKSAERASAADAMVPHQSVLEQTIPLDAEHSDSGLISKLLVPGSGDKRPGAQDKVRLNFTAWNAKGEVVDGSEKRGGPVTFEVTGVIAGWTEALQQMRVGERRRLWIPDQLVYPGRPGFPRPLALFELELLEILEGRAPPPAPADVAAAPARAIKTRSGLAYAFLTKGPGGDKPKAWDRVGLHHAGWTSAGAPLESSPLERAAVFDVSGVMPGWTEALQLLSVGDKVRVWIPEALAHQGRVGQPRGALVFDLELASIERRPEPPHAPADIARAPRSAKRTASGLAYRIVRKGDGGATATARDRVEVHYAAWTSDGKLFDSSVVRGTPATIPVSRVIPGWSEGLQLMGQGDKALFWIPEQLAYAGREGSPRGMLVYEVELLKIAN
jgi:FKBP-type peptidyl-prolyl cis-trans isomerase